MQVQMVSLRGAAVTIGCDKSDCVTICYPDPVPAMPDGSRDPEASDLLDTASYLTRLFGVSYPYQSGRLDGRRRGWIPDFATLRACPQLDWGSGMTNVCIGYLSVYIGENLCPIS